MTTTDESTEMVPKKGNSTGSQLDQDPKAVAAELQCAVVFPKENELQIDLDHIEDHDVMFDMINVLRHNGLTVDVTKVTKSLGGNHHGYVQLNLEEPIDEITRIAFQACLGSDRTRELLSLLRILLKTNRPATCFFEREPT